MFSALPIGHNNVAAFGTGPGLIVSLLLTTVTHTVTLKSRAKAEKKVVCALCGPSTS